MELEASQRETRNAATEAFRLRNSLDEAAEQVIYFLLQQEVT